MEMRRSGFAVAALAVLMGLATQQAAAQRGGEREAPVSPQVHEDNRVTIAIRAPGATKVTMSSGEIGRITGEGSAPMKKSDNGDWSVTVGPLPPGIYDYSIDVDGLRIADPISPHVFGNRRGARGYVEVPGPPGKPRHDEWRDVPHGQVTKVWYESATAGARRRMHVYTPPGYTQHPWRRYPVLYLLHGSGDNDSHWTLLGQANVILDNLIADGNAKPMVVVMPDGHVSVPRGDLDQEEWRIRSSAAFEDDLIGSIMPCVEKNFRVSRNRARTAIVGLSMGGGQSLRAGLGNLDQFAWIGAFSASPRGLDSTLEELAKNPERTNRRIRLLWIAIGKDDFLLERNHAMIKSLKEKGIEFEYKETEGAHMWSVWRRYLAEFAPRLFR